MRVVLNQLAALGLRTGIGHYTTQLYRCLLEQAGDDEIHAFPTGWLRRARKGFTRIRPYLEGNISGQRTGIEVQPSLSARARAQALQFLRQGGRAVTAHLFRKVCAREGYDLYHEPNFIPLPSSCPTMATLHDLSVLLHPEWHPRDRVVHFERYFRKGIAHCVHFMAISEFGRQEVIRNLNVSPERVTCSYMGIRPGLSPWPRQRVAEVLRQLGLPAQYLLCLGTIEPRKNVLMLLRAYCALPESLRSSWPLLLVGSWGWNTQDVADYLHREARPRGVIHLGYVAEKHLAALYNGARALVYPSLYEGFGLPPIEMMACGGAVLASTAGALVETVGSRAHLLPPEDEAGWHHALARVLRDDDWWRSLRRGVTAVARPYTWDQCAAVTLRVYRLLCGVPEEERPLTTEWTRELRAAG